MNRPVNTLKSGPTAAGIALIEKRKEQERLAALEKEARENKNDDMDVDDENGKGKGRRYVPPMGLIALAKLIYAQKQHPR